MLKSNFSDQLSFPTDFDQSFVQSSPIAVLTSGGADSAILAAALCDRFSRVFPIYVRFGLSWESVEQSHLQRYLKSIANPKLADLLELELPMKDVYQNHWSTTGKNVPDASSDDAAVYLPGRNILLISKTAVWCALNGVSIIALGSLARNPFADATDSFFETLEMSLTEGLEHKIRIVRPLKQMHKQQVLEAGCYLPVHLSFSCIQPVEYEDDHIHCGVCNKCQERRVAFKQTDFQDQTRYATDQTKAVGNLCIK